MWFIDKISNQVTVFKQVHASFHIFLQSKKINLSRKMTEHEYNATLDRLTGIIAIKKSYLINWKQCSSAIKCVVWKKIWLSQFIHFDTLVIWKIKLPTKQTLLFLINSIRLIFHKYWLNARIVSEKVTDRKK